MLQVEIAFVCESERDLNIPFCGSGLSRTNFRIGEGFLCLLEANHM